MHDLTGISFGVQALSWCAAFAEPGERAARLLGASQAVWRTSGAKVDETNAYSVFDKRSEDALREALGSGRSTRGVRAGVRGGRGVLLRAGGGARPGGGRRGEDPEETAASAGLGPRRPAG